MRTRCTKCLPYLTLSLTRQKMLVNCNVMYVKVTAFDTCKVYAKLEE